MKWKKGFREIYQTLKTDRGKVSAIEAGLFFCFLAVLNLLLVLIQVRQHRFISVLGNATPQEALASWGTSDAGSYLGAAISIVETGGVSPDWQWVTNIWSPGMPRLVAFAVSLAGERFQFIEILGSLGAIVIALTMTLLYAVLRLFTVKSNACILVGIIIAQPIYWKYLLIDRVPWSDGYPSVLVVGAVCLLVLALNSTNKRSQTGCSIFAGLFLAGALYLRSQWMYLPHLLLGSSLLLGAYWLLRSLYFKMKSRPCSSENIRKQLVTSLVAGLVSLLLALPYTLWREEKFPDAPSDFGMGYGWTMSTMIAAHYNWLYPDQLAGFVTAGGGGTACRVDPKKCEEFHQRESVTPSPFNIYDEYGVSYQEYNEETVAVALKRPIEWFKYKAPIMWRQWTIQLSGKSLIGQIDKAVSWLALVNIWWLFRLRRSWRVTMRTVKNNTPAVLLCIAILFFVFVPPYLAHFEPRYFLLPRLFILLPTAVALHQIGSEIRRKVGTFLSSQDGLFAQQKRS